MEKLESKQGRSGLIGGYDENRQPMENVADGRKVARQRRLFS